MKAHCGIKKKVLIALSGGVDSSVAASMLIADGYDVTAAFMVQYYDPKDPQGLCWRSEYRDAVRVAAHLGINIVRWHFEQEYHDNVFSYMKKEYAEGRTPNPDVLCNRTIKFGAWLKRAKQEGYEYLATGHYARVDTKNGILLTAKDTHKDQTYFLHQVSKNQLQHVLFPLGNMTKKEVRAYAKKTHLPTAEKSESMGLCFVGKVPIREFLQHVIHSTKGKVMDADTGKAIGKHLGAWYYTIGQRHVGVSVGHALYVVGKDMKKNIVYAGSAQHTALHPTRVPLSSLHTISGEPIHSSFSCAIRFRHGGEKIFAKIVKEKRQYMLMLKKPVWAPAPGQFAVFYDGEVCVGGGVVAESRIFEKIV